MSQNKTILIVFPMDFTSQLVAKDMMKDGKVFAETKLILDDAFNIK